MATERLLRIALLLAASLLAVTARAGDLFHLPGFLQADAPLRVTIEDPFIELHGGAGRGYPVLEVVEQGDSVEVLEKRTTWYKLRTTRGVTGWTPRHQLLRTLMPSGARFAEAEISEGDVLAHRWEVGAEAGAFDGAALMGLHGAWRFSPGLSAEVAAAQSIGRYADSLLVDLSLAGHPFPEWRASPYFTIGTGIVNTQPASTLVGANDREDQTLSTGIGVQGWLSRAFVARIEYRHYLLLTSRDENGEIDTWKAGLSVFF